MLAEHLYRGLKLALANEVQATKDRLAKGHWKTEAEGKAVCGEIKGLEKAGDLLQAELEKLVKLEEDDIDHD